MSTLLLLQPFKMCLLPKYLSQLVWKWDAAHASTNDGEASRFKICPFSILNHSCQALNQLTKFIPLKSFVPLSLCSLFYFPPPPYLAASPPLPATPTPPFPPLFSPVPLNLWQPLVPFTIKLAQRGGEMERQTEIRMPKHSPVALSLSPQECVCPSECVTLLPA